MIEALLNSELFLKFIRFGIVGFMGFVIDFGLTYFFKEKAKVQKYVANGIGFSLAAINNYILNRCWTFHSHNANIMLEFSVFIVVSIVGLALSTLIIWLLVQKNNFKFYPSKLASIFIVMIWNFFINLLYTFV
ncbi:MAG: GtrA family protein [Bacteroidota bacterium]